MQISEYKERLIRALADMENSRQRSALQADNSRRFAVQVRLRYSVVCETVLLLSGSSASIAGLSAAFLCVPNQVHTRAQHALTCLMSFLQ